jgi:hypothetical protein
VNERSSGGSLPGLDTALGYDPLLEVAAPHGGTRWELQRNFCASRDYREHFVSWDSNEGHASLPADNTGAGDGAGFVACLAAGDRISVIARAMVRLSVCEITILTASFAVSRMVQLCSKCSSLRLLWPRINVAVTCMCIFLSIVSAQSLIHWFFLRYVRTYTLL